MRFAVIGAAVIAATSVATEARQATGTPTALVIAYADGRVTSTIIGTRPARAWTPMFPRIASWRPPRQTLPATAIQYVSTREDDAVRVVVSVLLGEPHQKEEKVAEVLVQPGAPVRVEGLTRFGIQPVELSLSPVGALAIHPPVVESKATGLTIDGVELVPEAPPRYRITVRNRSSKAARSFFVAAFRQNRPALSTRQADPRARAIVPPGDTHTFDLALSGVAGAADRPVSAEPLDAIELQSVVWEDGTSDGEPKPAAEARLMDLGRLAQLRRLVAILEEAGGRATADRAAFIGTLRRAIADLPIEATADVRARAVAAVPGQTVDDRRAEAIVRVGMQRIKDLALQDLAALEKEHGLTQQAMTEWLARTLSEYREWSARLDY